MLLNSWLLFEVLHATACDRCNAHGAGTPMVNGCVCTFPINWNNQGTSNSVLDSSTEPPLSKYTLLESRYTLWKCMYINSINQSQMWIYQYTARTLILDGTTCCILNWNLRHLKVMTTTFEDDVYCRLILVQWDIWSWWLLQMYIFVLPLMWHAPPEKFLIDSGMKELIERDMTKLKAATIGGKKTNYCANEKFSSLMNSVYVYEHTEHSWC